MISLAYLAIALPLPLPFPEQRRGAFLALYMLSWILLFGGALRHIASTFWIAAWNACVLGAMCVSEMEELWVIWGYRQVIPRSETPIEENEEQSVQEEGSIVNHEQSIQEGGSDEHRSEATETTPLLTLRKDDRARLHKQQSMNIDTLIWWLVQVVVSIPVQAILLGTILFTWLAGVAPTIVDGGPVIIGTSYEPPVLRPLPLTLK